MPTGSLQAVPLPVKHLDNHNRGDSHEDRHRRRDKDERALRLNHDGLLLWFEPGNKPLWYPALRRP
jgi:hypothetical protein